MYTLTATELYPAHTQSKGKLEKDNLPGPLLSGPLFDKILSKELSNQTAVLCKVLLEDDPLNLSVLHESVTFVNNYPSDLHVDYFAVLEFSIQNRLYDKLFDYFSNSLKRVNYAYSDVVTKLPYLLITATNTDQFDLIPKLAKLFSSKLSNFDEEQKKEFTQTLVNLIKNFVQRNSLDQKKTECLLLLCQEFKLARSFAEKFFEETEALKKFRYHVNIIKLLWEDSTINLLPLVNYIMHQDYSTLSHLFTSLNKLPSTSERIDFFFQQLTQDKNHKELEVVLAMEYLRTKLFLASKNLLSLNSLVSDPKFNAYSNYIYDSKNRHLISTCYDPSDLIVLCFSIARSKVIEELTNYLRDNSKFRKVHHDRAVSLERAVHDITSFKELSALLENQKKLFDSNGDCFAKPGGNAHTKKVVHKNTKSGRFFTGLTKAEKITAEFYNRSIKY